MEAENGAVVLARLRERAAGLILLDLMMSEMDGFELVEEVRRQEAWRALPVVVITGPDLSAADRARLSGSVERVLEKGAPRAATPSCARCASCSRARPRTAATRGGGE